MKVCNESNVDGQKQTKTAIAPEYTQFTTRYDSETSAIWCWMSPEPRPCMNVKLIDELVQLQRQITDTYTSQNSDTIWPFRHLILASKIPGIYNLGGDLGLIKEYIVNNEEDKLRDYAYKATNLIHRNINNLDLPITMISLVQGQALGAGFEAALSCDVIIAERSSKLGFPEILFNMFPGMGAYNLLARRIGTALAERIILSGKTYTAEELYDMGVIDVIAEDGEGVQATENYLNSHNQSHNTIRSMKKIRQIVHPITQQDLFEIVDIWMEASMKLSEKDLSKMERLLFLQTDTKNTKNIKESESSKSPRRGDWRKIKDVSFPLTTHLGESVHENRRKNDGRRQKTE
ncbi:MAG: crotonase/enoyl-CoA hydratase family protein [Gammaproteobacteria bacterium]|nr:crotonase/enoyl-CoA hydratase family protein [Gammaproteobacteria bacterium]